MFKKVTINEFLEKNKLNFNKTQNLLLFNILNTTSASIARKIKGCANRIELAQNLENETRITKSYLCKNRLCPFCSVMKSRKRLKNFFENSKEKNFNNPFIFLTLTVPSCDLANLKKTVSLMNKSFNRLKQYPCFRSVIGYIRKLEVTRGQTNNTQQCHPHFHCLLEVKKSYFARDYVRQEEWLNSWRKATKNESISQVDIRRVKGKLELAILEVIKYELKPENWKLKEGEITEDLSWWLRDYYTQMKRKRSISTSGSLKKIISKRDEENLLDTVDSEFVRFIYLIWRLREYVIDKVEEMPTLF